MSKLLNSAAVGAKTEDDAKEILQTYLSTEPAMVLSHTLETALANKPRALGAGDQFEPR